MKNTIILIIALFGIFAFTACDKNNTVTPEDKTVNITDDITKDITFKDGFTYIIKGVILVKNATITVQPGATIRFMPAARLGFAQLSNETATIKAIGTAAKPITFTSSASNPAKGDWDCLYFYSGSTGCEFENCVFEYGGGNTSIKSMIVIKQTSVSFKSCVFRKSASSALYLLVDGFFKNFTMNTLTDNESYPIIITPNYVHTIGLANTITTTSGISVSSQSYLDKSGSYTWLNQGVPYIIMGDLRVGSTGEGVILTISPGTVLKFVPEARVTVAYTTSDIATIKAIGTPTEKIVFTANNANPVKKDWVGFNITGGARNCDFQYCEFSQAGSTSSSSGVLYLNQCGTEVSISNSLIAHSISYGISVDKTSSVNITNGVTFLDIDKDTYHVR
jgi:hypothetical protein